MTIDKENLLESILASLDRIDYIQSKDVPNIDLYMDQVTTFMDSQLEASKRYPEDKILTKTMINNYAKNHLLPAPDKKKYSKEHILLLIYIYYFKNILSITDIQTLLTPMSERYFKTTDDLNLESIYQDVVNLEKSQLDALKEDLIAKYNRSTETFQDSADSEKDFLQLFSFICMLSFDVYLKKQVIEKLIDQLPSPDFKHKPKDSE